MPLNDIRIRETTQADLHTILEVEAAGFGYEKEAQLVEALLSDPTAEPVISLLAFDGEKAVGHILFTRAYFDGQDGQPLMYILAPLAVVPAYQRKGIGGKLIQTALQFARAKGAKLAFVLGHKEYYPRYGFEPYAETQGFAPPYPVPQGEYWMVQSLAADGFAVGKGKVRCADVLNRPEHWRDDESDR